MASLSPLSQANTNFALALLKKLSDGDKTTNVFFSPFSISSALTMVMLGAGGNTATQISECLKNKDIQDQVHVNFGQLLSELNKPDASYSLSVANRLYGEQSYQFVEEFLGNTKKHYEAELESVDFIKNFEAARLNINNWVEAKTQGTMASLSPLSQANTNFALALLKKLSDGDKTTNVFFSPFSISSALAMVMLGAGGNTATQMSECLKTKEIQDQVHVNFGQLLSELNKPDASYSLSVANRLYGEQSYQFVEEFLGNTKKHYEAELESVDFIKSFEAARLNINNWVEAKTQGKIKDLLGQGVVDALTRLVLINAIYFKGNWNKKFQENSTRDAQFKINKNDAKPVKMMYQRSKFPLTYIPEINSQILEMPYQGKELSMLIFLPNEMADSTTGLEKLEKELTYDNFVEWTRPDKMHEVEVQVGLPRFKMEEKYDLKSVLVNMGMVDAFDMAASDFSGMSPNNDLVLSKVVHKAFVEVNEEGTEAAAATAAITLLRSSFPLQDDTFIADHPFLFFIRHNPSKSILFAGRYCSPE